MTSRLCPKFCKNIASMFVKFKKDEILQNSYDNHLTITFNEVCMTTNAYYKKSKQPFWFADFAQNIVRT